MDGFLLWLCGPFSGSGWCLTNALTVMSHSIFGRFFLMRSPCICVSDWTLRFLCTWSGICGEDHPLSAELFCFVFESACWESGPLTLKRHAFLLSAIFTSNFNLYTEIIYGPWSSYQNEGDNLKISLLLWPNELSVIIDFLVSCYSLL